MNCSPWCRPRDSGRKMWFTSTFVYSLILLVSSSKCPEPKKPHLTSCTIFYNCVNLPGGGYVWVPSRCTDGLVFQPYLRMCVVPGDIWTCDTLSTDSSLITKRYETPESIDSTDTSYLGYTQDSTEFSEVIDSSYVIDDFIDSTTEAVTAYPLIEFEEPSEATYGGKNVRNVSYHKEENYLYEYINRQQVPLPLMQKYKNIVNDHYKWLSEMMNRLHAYKQLSAAISDSLSVSIKETTTVSPTRAITIFATQKQNISLNYLVQKCNEGNRLHNDEPSKIEESDVSQGNVATTSTESTLKLLIDSLDSDNNIIMINDNLGNKRYLTINRYKAIAQQLSPQSVSVVECTKNVRLSNKTSCDRYYMCDPKTASVMEYSCPLHTAFNVYLRICDTESAETCKEDKSLSSEIFVEHENTYSHNEDSSEEKLCQELGKIKDPTSDFHYYICYSMPGSEEIKSIQMTCPNALIFCQNKRVCTTRRLCNISR